MKGPFHCNNNKATNNDHDIKDPDNFYFKSNGNPSTLCLIHEIQLHAKDNIAKSNAKVKKYFYIHDSYAPLPQLFLVPVAGLILLLILE